MLGEKLVLASGRKLPSAAYWQEWVESGHGHRYSHCAMTKSARELMRKKERAVLGAQQLVSEEELEQVYGQIAQGVLTCTGSMRMSDDNAVAAAVCLLVGAGRVDGSRWAKWRAFRPMWQDLRVV